MNKSLIFWLFFIMPIFMQSQYLINSDSLMLKSNAFQQLTGEKYTDPGYKFLSIYFKDYWIPGTILLTDSQQINNLSLKYNSSNNQLVMLNDKFGLVKIDNEVLTDFYLNDKSQTYHFKKIKLDSLNYESNIFYQFIYTGKIDIYVYRRVKPDAISYRDDGEYTIYSPNPVYILIVNGRKILLNKAKPKAVFAQFPQLKEILKQKSIPYKKKTKTEESFFSFLKVIEDVLVETIH